MDRTARLAPASAVTLVAGAIALTALLAGCAPGEPDATASPSPVPTTSEPAETTAPPTESSPPTGTPSAGDTDRPIEAIDAYSLCRAQTSGYYGDPGTTVFAPFEEATVLLRDDGDWYVYMEVDDPSRGSELAESAGSECIVGGTIAEPAWQVFGTIAREYADESIADYNRPPAQE
jgi:hypothetical protein